MRISFDALLILDAIGRRGSFAAAAEELCRVPSTITYAVQKLEDDLGVPLFERNGHRPRLTLAGEALLKESRPILQAAADLEERVKRASQGYDVKVEIELDGVLPCAPLLELAREFYADPAHVGTELRIVHAGAERSEARKADLMIGVFQEEALKRPRRHSRFIGSLNLALVVGAEHPLARHTGPVPNGLLYNHRLALLAGAPNADSACMDYLAPRQKTVTLPTFQAKLEVLKAGAAAGFVARAVAARELQAGELVEIVCETMPPAPKFCLVWEERPKSKCFQWWLDRLDRPTLLDDWLAPSGRTAKFSTSSFVEFQETSNSAR